MMFEWPILLWGLILVPLALGAYILIQRRRNRFAVRFTNLDLLANLVQQSPGWRRHVPAMLYLAALTALITSLARPYATVPVPREQATVMLVMDVSGSMAATDVQPNRLAAAQAAANRFIDQVPDGVQVGLVSFASSAQTLSPPTKDRVALRQAIDSLRIGGGTAMGDGLDHALNGLVSSESAQGTSGVNQSNQAAAASEETQVPAAVVLLSDGANSSGTVLPADAAQRARRLGVLVYTIALGTADGVVTAPAAPNGQPQMIRVPPDSQTLQEIAEISGARFFSAPTEDDLQTVYRDLGSRIGFVEERQEITFLFATAALILMAGGGALAALWFNRFP